MKFNIFDEDGLLIFQSDNRLSIYCFLLVVAVWYNRSFELVYGSLHIRDISFLSYSLFEKEIDNYLDSLKGVHHEDC